MFKFLITLTLLEYEEATPVSSGVYTGVIEVETIEDYDIALSNWIDAKLKFYGTRVNFMAIMSVASVLLP